MQKILRKEGLEYKILRIFVLGEGGGKNSPKLPLRNLKTSLICFYRGLEQTNFLFALLRLGFVGF